MTTLHITLYGIPNCDTVKKSRAWFQEQGISATFHDFKKQGVPSDRLADWMQALGWQKVLNRQGTTWRKLAPDVQASVTDAPSAAALLPDHASLIKRPIVECTVQGRTHLSVGFVPTVWQAWLAEGKSV